LDPKQQKQFVYRRASAEAAGFGLEISEKDSCSDKPWGAYLRIAESSLSAFYEAYWQGIEAPKATPGQRLDPKILIVAPAARLSLQYHHRRGEHWRVLDGPVKIVKGNDGATLQEIIAQPGDIVRIPQGQWHRLVGMDTWGRVAEIWEHTDPVNPTDENDIVRVQDDYGR
jgi:mannose-6-phosphate isomerase